MSILIHPVPHLNVVAMSSHVVSNVIGESHVVGSVDGVAPEERVNHRVVTLFGASY